jgi:hypothetical protein
MEVGSDGAAATSTIKLAGLSLDLGGLALFLSPPSHCGGVLEERLQDEVVVADSMEGIQELLFFLARITW